MAENFAVEGAQFFTATIYKWNHLLSDNNHKDIIIDSLRFLVENKRIELNAFIIMSNHIHLIWQPLLGYRTLDIQSSFLKFTANKLKRAQISINPQGLSFFKVGKMDREYQIWKRESLNVELISKKMFLQKLDYIHYNAVTAGLCKTPEEYFYSSARFYYNGENSFGILRHYSGN